jgi:flagellar biosynthesis protein FlhA
MPPAASISSPVPASRHSWQDFVLPVALVASVLVILVPLPATLMDALLAANITIAVIMLLTTIYVRTPLEFSIFPSLLLATTLGRLVLNVATTRLILTEADTEGLLAAGGVIKTFGEFVAGDNVVVGIIIFVIIVVIQFVVITKGATRISEVAARFALDGMPGRQMAIDADLQAGIIDEREAQRRRQDITRQADFYGAMDGASKFVRGDAIAGIIITLINILGGFAIGVWFSEPAMSLSEAAKVFTKLSIGDGLVTQVPAFLISLAAGLLVTRSTEKTDLPKEFLTQLFARPQALIVAGLFLFILIGTSLPKVPLLTIGSACLGLAYVLGRSDKVAKTQAAAADIAKKAEPPPEEPLEKLLLVDPMEIEISTSLIRLADPKRGGELLERIRNVRQYVASQIGIVMPKVRIRDNHRFDRDGYRIKIADAAVAEGTLMPTRLLALESPATTGKLPGIDTKEPAFGTAAVWIEPGQVGQAEMLGYTVVEPVSVLATHLQEVVRNHADEILTRDATKHLIDELKKTSPAVVDELIPKQLSLAEVQVILQMLLREQIPIRQLGAILETLGDSAARLAKDPILLTEQVRHRLSRTICDRWRGPDKRLHVVTIDPAMEDRIRAGVEAGPTGLRIRMSPQAIKATCEVIAKEIEKLVRGGRPPIVLVNPQIRPALKQLTAPHLPKLVVLSYNEITRDTIVEAVGMVSDAVPK